MQFEFFEMLRRRSAGCAHAGHMLAAPMLEGLPPNNATHRMRLAGDETTARRVADIIVESFDPAETAAAAFEAIPGADWKPGLWVVEAYFAHAPDEKVVRDLVTCAAGPAAADDLTFGLVEKRDWVAASLAGLHPVRAGRFLLYGGHNRGSARPNDIGIEIEAALAFGTGHHGSTRGCLVMLDRLARRRRPKAILDVGTGSGVLAIAAAKRFRRAVAAGDIDPVAVTSARANARQNGVGALVRPVVARGLHHPALESAAPFDLVFANILARPLRQLSRAIAALLAPGGEVILSGLLACDAAGVVSAYRSQGLVLMERLDLDGWVTLAMRRPASPV